MRIFRKHPTARGCVLLFSFALLGLAVRRDHVVAAQAESISATYSEGAFSLTLPYHAPRLGHGQLFIEVLDPEDRMLGRAVRNAEVERGDGRLEQKIKLDKPLPIEDLVWDRVRYRFEYTAETEAGAGIAFEGTRSISQILRRPVVHILGQRSYFATEQAAVRVIVSDAQNEPVAGNSSVRIELLDKTAAPRLLYLGRLNRRGTTEAQLRFPAGLVGDYQLHYITETPIGSAEYTQDVQLQDAASVLLTTEKPIYQPGQSIHARALVLDRGSHAAAADRQLTFEVEDSRGNKVFKKSVQTDKFGIASAEFNLADEVNLGVYHLRALIGDPESPSTSAESTLNVERYVLPKFKVAIDFNQKDNKPKRDYRPGDHVTGVVRANYFFGKPVDNSEVNIKATSMDVALVEAGGVSGKTDKDGDYHFDLTLPDYFAGHPLAQGTAQVLIEATVKDSADHAEIRGEPITVSQSPLLITAVPEGGTLIPHLDNQVFILTSYPDGTPAKADVSVQIPGSGDQHVATDSSGVAVIQVKAGKGAESLKIDADDGRGAHASTGVELPSRDGEDQILLRSERAVYRAGDRIDLKVFSTRQRGAAYVDVVKDGQTIVTRDLDIENGEAALTLTATPEMAGTLDLHAYLFGRDAQPIGDHRLVFVQPAEELRIEAATDAQAYKPGAEARIRFRITNSRGQGVSAALGLQVVDEAVFALAEKQPGFAKVFFYLEQEAMKPRYEIHSLSMSDVVEPVQQSQVEQRNRAAQALFAATEMVNPNKLDTEFGRTLPQEKRAEYAARYQAAFLEQVKRLAAQLSAGHLQDADLARTFSGLTSPNGRPRDAWGTELRAEAAGWYSGWGRFYLIRSAGPDRQFDTADDLAVYLEVHSGNVTRQPNAGKINLRIEHDRGPFNGRAEVAGSVTDATGAVIPAAMIEVTSLPGAKTLNAVADASGQFALSSLPSGKYNVEISSPGFEIASLVFSVEPRDHAVLTASLTVGAASETVTVTNGGFGVAGGVMGGIMHGVAGAPFAQAAMGGPIPINGRNLMEMQILDRVTSTTVSVNADRAQLGTESSAAPAAHVRSYFPEALYINPEIVTDGNGVASISIPLADSITTWRMAMLASTERGALGSATSSLKVFQDFFIDLDLPVTLTQGDRVSIPVAVYNYSGQRGGVTLKLQSDDWFTLAGDVSEKNLSVDSSRVGGSQFTLEARRIGKFKLTLSAQMKGAAKRADIVVREIEVVPNGREQNSVFNGRLDGLGQGTDTKGAAAQHDLKFPQNSIPDATTIFVRFYPGPLSQIIEGMDSILRMPGGCFEQTSSSTYPNVLALDYMKRTKKLTPEVHAKAEGYIANGYQRLLTFEVPGGGFSWFGNAPANKILTAYGLMEFNDMSKVYDVDSRLIQRTQEWLAQQQQPDGSWKPDTSFINEGATNRFNTDALRITAYLAWSLKNTGYQGPAVEKAKQFVEAHLDGNVDAYTLAVVANFATDYSSDREFTRHTMQLLLDARVEKDDQAWWNADETAVYSTGQSASVETTGLAAQALLKWGQASAVSRKALAYLASKKDASGTWGTTQATIMVLRALLLATEKGSADVRGTVRVLLNGKTVETLQLTPENNDLLHQFVLKGIDPSAANAVRLEFEGDGGLAYQVVGRYFIPWEQKPANEALSIDVAYDRTQLAQSDIATATATVRNNLNKTANMVMVDLGIPPGFDLLSEDLQAYQEKSAGSRTGRLEKFNQTATQAILYFNAFAPGETVKLRFRLRAKYPIRARSFQSRVYEYYDPEVSSIARPIQLEVRPH